MLEFWIFLTIEDYVPESGTGRNPGRLRRQKTTNFGMGMVVVPVGRLEDENQTCFFWGMVSNQNHT